MSVLHGVRRSSLFKSVSKILPLLFSKDETSGVSDLMFTSREAVEELKRRQEDPVLRKKVEEYLAGDIPEYFKDGPILYLARHIITPNFETIRFIESMRQLGLGMKIVVSQDSRGMFVPYNYIKKALCKLPICRRLSKKGAKLNEHYENVTIVDFNAADGKKFSDIQTLWEENLIDFHKRLFSEFIDGGVELPDDATWIDKHHRHNLLEHYKHLLALFVVHGIFFENYDMNDPHEKYFVNNILRPACHAVEERFGYRPLLVELFPPTPESNRFWISYPHKVLDIVRKSMGKGHTLAT